MKIKWFIYLLISAQCFVLAGCSKTEIVEYETGMYIKERDNYIQSIPSEVDKSICIISNNSESPLIVPDKYVIDYYMELEKKRMVRGGYGTDNTVKKLVAYVQDISTLELIKEIDVNLFLEPHMEDYQVVGYFMEFREKNGKYYLERRMWERYSEEELRERTIHSETEMKELWIDVETEETQLHEWKENNTVSSENIWMLRGTGIVRKAISENASVKNSYYISDTSHIDIPTVSLPKNNKKLYEIFPELKNVAKEEGLYAHIFLTPQTNNLYALSLLLEDEADIDFNVLQPDSDGYFGYYTRNGERHYITAEDYAQFQAEYWEYRKKQREEYGILQPEEKE